ncbi:MAG: hypothetical protein A3J74_10300 [Elusimicrobia bacterium RIFCSPHIGHO2_02_FULL_57_9]|nr:MAG: hypothetical protein A3J74_10300 [Elusimicrobia bacterium RIFCSPHIGHO2_02_FULL_57_9]
MASRYWLFLFCLNLAACLNRPSLLLAQVKAGIDVLEENGFHELKGKKFGLLTNQTGVDRKGRHVIELLARAPETELVCVFAPEHGFLGGSENERIEDGVLDAGGHKIPVYSLYNPGMEGKKPKQEQLRDIDALVFDIQDIGARFYTYLASMALAMEAAQEKGIEFIVLDRPNPISGAILEGPILEGYQEHRKTKLTAYFPIPVRHGMTAGEIAKFYAAEIGYERLTVIKAAGWARGMWYDQTGLSRWWDDTRRRPSPNIPNLEAAILYPGIGLFEPSNLSVGRGVDGSQFQLIGAPWLDSPAVVDLLRAASPDGASFSAEDFTPGVNKYYPYYGQRCHGIRIAITDREQLRPMAVFLALTRAMRKVHGDKLAWKGSGPAVMTGLKDFNALYRKHPGMEGFQELFDRGARDFEQIRKPYLLY